MLKIFSLILTALIVTGCAYMNSKDPNDLSFSIPPGSTLSLNNKLTISPSNTHALIQHGAEIKERDKNDYSINCRLELEDFGPRTIEPEVFNITRTEDGKNWVSQPSILRFYTEVYLSSNHDTDVIKLVCQLYGDQIDRNFTVAEMQAALDDLFTFKFNQAEK